MVLIHKSYKRTGKKPCTRCGSVLPKDHTGKPICRTCLDKGGIDAVCKTCGVTFQTTSRNPNKTTRTCPKCRRANPKDRLAQHEPPPPNGEELSPAARELASRALARKYLWAFVLRHDPKYMVGWFHRDLSSRLERFLKQVEDKQSPRLMIQVPPRHGKSRLASQEFPAWLLGHHPEWEIITSSYAVSLPVDFSRNIRERLRDETYKATFPKTILHPESQSVESWRTTDGGGFLAAGVGGPITGKGAHVLVVDDPIKNAEEAESQTIRNAIWNWYTSTAYTRLAPGGGILIIQCMTGDTQVLMADGTERRLDSVKKGDRVATFDNGRLSTSVVRNWALNGLDCVHAITTTSGKIVRANARHPFLVYESGQLVWKRLRELKPGTALVSLKDVPVCREAFHDPENAEPVSQPILIGASTPTPRASPWGITENGKGSVVRSKAATSLRIAKACARRTMVSIVGLLDIIGVLPVRIEKPTSNIGMGSRWKSMIASLLNKAVFARSASSLPAARTHAPTGITNSASTIATTPNGSEGCYATTATLRLGTQRPPRLPQPWLSTFDFTLDEVVSVVETGTELVYDIQIDRTENFIANGLVSHNTRWHTDDLSGRVEQQMTEEDGEPWEIVRYPAIALEDERFRKAGDALHPERYDIDSLERIKKAVGPRTWNALYMQNPVPDEGAYFTRSMIRTYEKVPDLIEIYNTWDLAVGQKQQNDWSVGVKWGVDPNDDIYILDVLRGRFDAAELVDHILDMWKSAKTQACGIEEGQIKLTLGPFLEQRVKERRMHSFHHVPLKPGRQDKVARARTLQGRMRQGQVYFPAEANWMDKLLDELLAFPFGKHDDQVDGLAYAAIMAADVTPPQIETSAAIDTTVKWKQRLLGYVSGKKQPRSWMAA